MKKKIAPYLYSMPALLTIILIVVIPIFYTIYISMTNMNVYHWFDFKFIGFENYSNALFAFDSGFWAALIRTVVWTVVNVTIQLVIAFFLAVLLNIKGLKLKGFYKTILMFPWAMPGYISILVWKMGMFNTEYGLLNQWMKKMHFEKVNWLSTDLTAFCSCTILNLWLAMPFMIMIIDGGLQSIDKTYYESATIDGAGFFKKLQTITVPLLRPVIAPMVIMTIFTTFKQFDIIYLLTQQNGSKTGAGIHTVLTYAYEKAFITNNYGYSSAVSIIIFVILLGFSVVSIKDLKEEGNAR